jgi:MFS family permease
MQIRLALLIVVLVLSVLSVGTYIWSFYKDVPTIPFEIFMGLPTSIIALLGTGKEKKKRRKDKRERRRAKPFRLMPSFDSGLYGGLIGGAIAGLIIGVMYYVDFMNAGWRIIPHIFIYASLVGTLLGASVQLIILWFRRLVTERQYSSLVFNEVSGGILGGAIAGIPVGALGGWFFGQRPGPFIDIGLLVTGSVLGAICIVLGVLLYDYEGRLRNVMRALLFSSVISAFAAMFGIVVLRFLNIGDPFFFSDATGIDFLAIEGGAILGLVIGIVLGFQVGCTLRLYRLWEVMTKPMGH